MGQVQRPREGPQLYQVPYKWPVQPQACGGGREQNCAGATPGQEQLAQEAPEAAEAPRSRNQGQELIVTQCPEPVSWVEHARGTARDSQAAARGCCRPPLLKPVCTTFCRQSLLPPHSGRLSCLWEALASKWCGRKVGFLPHPLPGPDSLGFCAHTQRAPLTAQRCRLGSAPALLQAQAGHAQPNVRGPASHCTPEPVPSS